MPQAIKVLGPEWEERAKREVYSVYMLYWYTSTQKYKC
jgi:hypothetical protein